MTLCLGLGDGRRRVPVSAPTTAALLDALLAARDDDSSAALRRTIELEPSLAVWTVAQAAVSGDDRPATAEQAAHWLTVHLAETLAASSALDEWDATILSATSAGELAARQVEIAHWIAALAELDGVDGPSAFFAGLLHDGQGWLDLCRAQQHQATDTPETPLLPAVGIERVATYFEQAQSIVAGRIAPPPQCASAAQLALEAAEEARQRWSAEGQNECHRLRRVADLVARLARLESEFDERLERAKLHAMAEFAAGAGHELNNPLAVISGRAQLLMRDEASAGRRRELAVIKGQAARVNEMIADVMLFGRPPRPRPASVDPVALIDRLTDRLRSRADAEDKTLVHLKSSESITVQADPVQLEVAIGALCENALDSISPGGRVTIAAAPLAGGVQITVRDDGPGIAADERANIFNPFYSGRQAGRGLGFGLSKCWRIVTNHGGSIEVDNPDDGGAQFTVKLPNAEETIPSTSSPVQDKSDR